MHLHILGKKLYSGFGFRHLENEVILVIVMKSGGYICYSNGDPSRHHFRRDDGVQVVSCVLYKL